MLIERESLMTGQVRTMDLDVTPEQIAAWEDGMLAQKAFPNLNCDQREFLISGMTPDEWDSMFPEEDD